MTLLFDLNKKTQQNQDEKDQIIKITVLTANKSQPDSTKTGKDYYEKEIAIVISNYESNSFWKAS